MKFLPLYRVSDCPFAPYWDWQMDQEEFLTWSEDFILQVSLGTVMTIVLSLSFDTAPTLQKILLATT